MTVEIKLFIWGEGIVWPAKEGLRGNSMINISKISMRKSRIVPSYLSSFERSRLLQLGLRGCRLNFGALMIRIGFWAHYTISIIRNPQHTIGIYLGPYSMSFGQGSLILSVSSAIVL